MPFPGSEAFRDQVIARAQEYTGNPDFLESIEERLIVRHNDSVVRRRQLEERVVRRAVARDGAVVLSEPEARARIPIPVREQPEFVDHGRGDRDVDVTQDPPKLCVEVDLELEGHQQRVCVEEDDPRHRFRALMLSYMGLR